MSLLAALAFIWASCSKSSNSTPSRIDLITQASWKYDTSGVDLNKDGVIDAGDTSIPPCEKQYSFQFNKDNTGVLTGGATKCNPSDPATTNFTWSLTGNNNVLSASNNSFLQGNIGILNVTQTQFLLYKDTTLMGTSLRYLISLKH